MPPARYCQAVRYQLPQPYQEVDHTADVGVSVEGASAEEALARLVLALAALLSGGGPVSVEREERIAAEAGGGLPAVAVALLRELLYRFATGRVLPASCEVLRMDLAGAEISAGLGRWDPELHREGLDVKAVTWHQARFEEGPRGRWRAQVLLDV
jgi:SHS2 domain-containing protein